MTPTEHWEQVWSVFEEAITLPPGQRRLFVSESCGGRPEVEQAVVGMLAADGEVGTILDQPPVARDDPSRDLRSGTDVRTAGPRPRKGVPPSLPENQSDPDQASSGASHSSLPSTIGPYRILKQVGEGGMSTVYLAVRSDDAYRRRVVVKVVRRDMVRSGVVRRLRAERQILASLEHPNIARLYDGAATEGGEPYFVLEYIEGLPIDDFCQHNRLSVGQRIALFAKVCGAVQYAHRNLIIHRDIKPSNILVTADGEPKLLDFGIAKVLNPEVWSIDPEPTTAADRMLTPSYASPEQYRGGTVTTTSDVYSLGVLLYRLLTGRMPHDLTGRSPGEIERALLETEPMRPSSAAGQSDQPQKGTPRSQPPAGISKDSLRRQLRGDLDAIVLKALRGAPEERYATVDRLTADLERYRQGQPVAARRGTWRYRSGKFVRRHRAGVIASAVAFATMTTAALALGHLARQASIERDIARLERDQKTAVIELMEDLVAHAEPFREPGQDLGARELILASERAIGNRLRDQPAVRAQLLHTTGSMLLRLGALDESERQLREALRLRKALYPGRHADVANTMRQLAVVYRERGALDEAESLAREAISQIRQAPDADANTFANCLTALAAVLCAREAFEAAEEPIREALALTEQAGQYGEQLQVVNLEFLAMVESRRGRYEEAVAILRESIRLRRVLFGEHNASLGSPLSDLGVALRWLGRWSEAESVYEEAQTLALKSYGKRHRDYAMITNNIGGVRFAQGDYLRAIEAYEDAHRALIDLVGDDHWRVFFVETNIEAARVRTGGSALAEKNLRAGRALWQERLGADHWLLAQVDSILGEAVAGLGRIEQAETLLVSGFERLVELGAADRSQRRALLRLTGFLAAQGRADETARFEAMLLSRQDG